MDKSFKVYVDIFDPNNSQQSEFSDNSLERKLDTYELVTKDDIVGLMPGETLKFASGIDSTHSIHSEPGSNNHEHGEAKSRFVAKEAPSGDFVPNEKEQSCKGKLCGFLKIHKTGDKIQHRRRWFAFNEEMCRLLYFRAPQDMIPRCDIDISSSSFYITEPSGDNSLLNKFEIRTKECVYFMEAANQKTMLYWLQELQNYREKYFASLSRNLPIQLHLLENENDAVPPPILKNVTLPRDTVGVQTKDDFRQGTFAFIHIRDEIKKMKSFVQQKHLDQADEDTNTSTSRLKQTLLAKTADVKQKILRHKPISDVTLTDRPQSHSSVCATDMCRRCSLLQDQIGIHKEEMQSLDEELQATRELNMILQKQIDEFVREKFISCSLAESNNAVETEIKMLKEQEKKIINLEHLLAATQEEKEILKATNRSLEGEIESLEDQISAFRDSIQAKDDVVINLTEQIMSYEKQYGERSDILENISFSSPNKNTLMNNDNNVNEKHKIQSHSMKEIQKYQDMVNGYKTQNQFLNKEILELNQLRQKDNVRQQEFLQTCLKLETRYYDEHRKYLACLKELGKSQSEDDPMSLHILKRLLEDAVSSRKQWNVGGAAQKGGNVKNSKATWSDDIETSQKYDEMGFPINIDETCEDDSFDDKMDTIKIQSDELYVKAKSIEDGLHNSLQWEKYMTNIGLGTPVQQSKELKYLIRTGVPHAHRPTVWKWCVNFQVENIKKGFQENYYESLIEELKDSTLLLNPTAKQVELDLLRTLPGNKFYENILSEKVQALRRILLAFSLHEPVVGYCQGLNRIAAIALLFLKEEDAFWCLVSIINCLLLPNYFCAGMQGAHTDQRVLLELLQEKLPALSLHLKQLKVDITVFTFNWFLTIYIDNIPPQMYLRIWDSFLYEGSKVLFRYAIAFYKHKEDEILLINDSSQMHLFLRSLGQKMFDVNKVAKTAFEGMNPFPMKSITAKRQHHAIIVKAELQKMQEQRESYRKRRQLTANTDK